MAIDVADPKGGVVRLGDLARQTPEDVNIRGGRVVNLRELLADRGEVKTLKATTLQVSGAVSLGSLAVAGTLTVIGAVSLASLAVTGNATIGGTLGVTGATTLTGALTAAAATFSGNVGIGVSPSHKLHVDGAIAARESNLVGVSRNSDNAFVAWLTGATGVCSIGSAGGATPYITFRPADVERVRIDSSGNVGIGTGTFGTSAAGVLALKNGTAPTTGPADTVQIYSSDDAAGHTIPSFYCEGTNVLATGQADSASSVRVKMRINGTVVTLLAI